MELTQFFNELADKFKLNEYPEPNFKDLLNNIYVKLNLVKISTQDNGDVVKIEDVLKILDLELKKYFDI